MEKQFNLSAARRFALGLSFALLPGSLLAQPPVPAAGSLPLSYSTGYAVPGGGQSQLALILAQQSAGGSAAAAPLVREAALHRPATLIPFAPRSPYSAGAVSADRPDVFGSVALPVSSTPLDGRWRNAQRAPVTGSAASYAASLRKRNSLDRIDAVNSFVNSKVRFVDDSRQFRRPDYWSPAADTLRRGSGDCEDYAIAKLQMLRRAGIADHDLYLVIVKDLTRRADHAVLVVRAAGQLLLLDNGTDRIVDATEVRDYRPVLTFAAAGKAWTHGYRRPSLGYGAPAFAARATAPTKRL